MRRNTTRPTPSWPGPGNGPADIVPPGITVFPLQTYPAEGRRPHAIRQLPDLCI